MQTWKQVSPPPILLSSHPTCLFPSPTRLEIGFHHHHSKKRGFTCSRSAHSEGAYFFCFCFFSEPLTHTRQVQPLESSDKMINFNQASCWGGLWWVGDERETETLNLPEDGGNYGTVAIEQAVIWCVDFMGRSSGGRLPRLKREHNLLLKSVQRARLFLDINFVMHHFGGACDV